VPYGVFQSPRKRSLAISDNLEQRPPFPPDAIDRVLREEKRMAVAFSVPDTVALEGRIRNLHEYLIRDQRGAMRTSASPNVS
jgi:hypothetical protein